MSSNCLTCGHKPLNGNRLTLTLTAHQVLALGMAASRGIDEWDYEPESETTPNARVRKSALEAYQIVDQTFSERYTQ